MKSLIMEGPAKSRVIDIEIPTPGPGEVLVKMKYCGVCSSELEPWKTAVNGQTFGHEPMGTIEAVGQGVTGLEKNDRVTGLSSPCYSQYTIMKEENCVVIPEAVADEDAMGEALA